MVRFRHPPRVGANERFAWQRAVDPLGTSIHLAMAALWCVLLGFPTSVVEFGLVPLLVVFLIRIDKGIMTLWPLIAQPAVWLMGVLFAWTALSLTWSGDAGEGVDTFGVWRWVLAIFLMWPVIDQRRVLIGALVVGMLCGQLSQIGHLVGTRFGIDALVWARLPGRNSGWWDPVVGGSLLVGVLGVHLAGCASRVMWLRVVGIVLTVATIGSLVLTGTRGAWLSAVALSASPVLLAAHRGPALGRLCVVLVVLAVVGVALFFAVAPINQRVTDGYREVSRAVSEKDFDSDTGARLLMAWWAVESMGQRPVRGVGAGGYRSWVVAHLESQGIDPTTRRTHAHAHNAYLQIGSELGLVGLVLSGAIVVLVLRHALGRYPVGYDAGPTLAIIGLLVVGLFDPIQLNAQTGALLATLFALTMPGAPEWRPDRIGYGGVG